MDLDFSSFGELPAWTRAQEINLPVVLRNTGHSLAKAAPNDPIVQHLGADTLEQARRIENQMNQGFRGFGRFLSKIPVGTALNALSFAPIPQSLIQQMIQKLQPPNA